MVGLVVANADHHQPLRKAGSYLLHLQGLFLKSLIVLWVIRKCSHCLSLNLLSSKSSITISASMLKPQPIYKFGYSKYLLPFLLRMWNHLLS